MQEQQPKPPSSLEQTGEQTPTPADQQLLVPAYDPFDITILPAVQSLLNSIGGMNDKDLVKLVREVWGDGYQYQSVSEQHVRAEMRGFLQDQAEMLQSVHPILVQGPEPVLPEPSQLPHTAPPSQPAISGNENSSAPLSAPNSPAAMAASSNSNDSGLLNKLGLGTR